MKKQTKEILPSQVYFLVMLLLGLVIIFETISLINVLSLKKYISQSTTPNLPRVISPPVETQETFNRGSIKLALEENQKVTPKRNLKAKIIFNSYEEPVGGVDLILNFDPNLVSITDIVGNKDIFKQIIINTQKEKEGEIKITAYQPTKILRGEENLGYLTFQLLGNSPTSIKIKFLGLGVVTDSNLVSQTTQKDILREVENLDLSL